MQLSHQSNAVCAVAFFIISLFTTSFALASTISLTPQNASPQQGTTVSIDLFMDFSDNPTLGGGIDIIYDGSNLDFLSFTFDSTFLGITDPSFTCPGAAGCPSIDQTNTVFNIAFGNFSGIGGPYLVGTLLFDILTVGTTVLYTTETAGPGGPFVSAATSTIQSVTYLGTSINAVPIPAAAYLFSSGLLGLAAFSRKRKYAR